jgi:hypothetical protein
MSKDDAVMIVRRAFSMYLLVWAVDAASYLPTHLFGLVKHWGDVSALSGAGSYHDYYLLSALASAVRVVILLALSAWSFRGGRWLQGFFSGTPKEVSQ